MLWRNKELESGFHRIYWTKWCCTFKIYSSDFILSFFLAFFFYFEQVLTVLRFLSAVWFVFEMLSIQVLILSPLSSLLLCSLEFLPKSWRDHNFIVIVAVFPLPSSRVSSSPLPEASPLLSCGQKLFPKPWCDHDLVIVWRIGLISLRHGSIDKVLILNYGLLAIIWVMNVFADDLCRLNGSCRTRGAVYGESYDNRWSKQGCYLKLISPRLVDLAYLWLVILLRTTKPTWGRWWKRKAQTFS